MAIKTILCLALLLALNSCIVSHSGTITSGPLLHVNDKATGVALGTTKRGLLFPVGGKYSAKMVYDAKVDLQKRFPLKEGEYYANFTCDINREVFLLYYAVRVTVSADIMKSSAQETK